MVLIALALARPVSVERVITPPVEGKDIMIVLDISGSMEALDFQHIYHDGAGLQDGVCVNAPKGAGGENIQTILDA